MMIECVVLESRIVQINDTTKFSFKAKTPRPIRKFY